MSPDFIREHALYHKNSNRMEGIHEEEGNENSWALLVNVSISSIHISYYPNS